MDKVLKIFREWTVPNLLAIKPLESFSIVGTVAVLIQLLGGWDQLMNFLLVAVVIDYVTGIFLAICNKELNSQVGFKGLAKKVLIFLLIIIASQLDMIIGNDPAYFRFITAAFYIANESISITENAAKLGLPVPKPLINILSQLRDGADQGKVNLDKEEM